MKKLILVVFAIVMIAAYSSHSLGVTLTEEEKAILVQTKQQAFGGLTFQLADQVQAGQIEPLMEFAVSDSLFVNWIIQPRKVSEFEAALNLPEGFKLAPIQLLERESANYYLSLNVYEVTIGAPAYRAEWSVYVTKGDDPTPRFMVIEALSSADTFDPSIGPVPAVDFEYSRQEGQVTAKINAENTKFEITFDENRAHYKSRIGTLAWAKSNDYIYWPNGIADKAYYNDSFTNQAAKLMKPRKVRMLDNTRWTQYVLPKPKHVLIYDEPLEFALKPWHNLKDESLEIEPALRGLLEAVKPQVFSDLTRLRASQIFQGTGEAIFDFTVENEVPAYFMNFHVPYYKVHALAERLALPEGLQLAPVSVFNHQYPYYMLSLNVYQGSGVAAGYRAEWSVYVSSDDKPMQPYFMVVDAATSNPSFDPVNFATPAAQTFSYEVDEAGIAHTEIVNGASSFSASFQLPTAGRHCPLSLNQDWVRANDRVYWLNGVYDRLLYNSLLTEAEVTLVNPYTVTISDSTPWAEFINPVPVEVFILPGDAGI